MIGKTEVDVLRIKQDWQTAMDGIQKHTPSDNNPNGSVSTVNTKSSIELYVLVVVFFFQFNSNVVVALKCNIAEISSSITHPPPAHTSCNGPEWYHSSSCYSCEIDENGTPSSLKILITHKQLDLNNQWVLSTVSFKMQGSHFRAFAKIQINIFCICFSYK